MESRNKSAGVQTAVPVELRPWRFAAIFAAAVLIGFGVLLAPFMRPAVLWFSQSLVAASATLIHVCGGRVTVEGAILRAPANGFAVEMKDGCNGINVTLLLWSAVVAFPASWSSKAKGIVAGGLAIQVINFVRFISLFYLGQYNMSLFEFAHGYLWESLIMLDAMVFFWLWVQFVSRAGAMSHVEP